VTKNQKPTVSTQPTSPSEHARVLEIRNEHVIIDYEVARLFGTETKKLNQQVTRNTEKFGDDYSFRLTKDEFDDLRSQNVTSSPEWGGTRYRPRVFTEHGVVMAATILKSQKAIQATRLIVHTFVSVRRDAWEKQTLKKMGGQLPLALDVPVRQGLITKLNIALGQVLDTIVEPEQGTTVRDEARAIAAEGLKSLKDYLKQAGISNEKTLAEVRRIMVEADGIEIDTARKKTENKHRQLALLAKKIKLVIQAQHYAETGSIEGLMMVLSDLERA
jgi:ORF6N domain